MEVLKHSNNVESRGSSTLLVRSSELASFDDVNWIDFGPVNEFHESMKHAQHLSMQLEDDDSSIPLGSDVDLGAPLTDLEDFIGSHVLDSEFVDDISAIARMETLLGYEVSLGTLIFLGGSEHRKNSTSSLSDDDQDSLQIDLLSRPMRRTSKSSKLDSSKCSNSTAPTVLMYSAEKARKSKKSSKDAKKKKKKKSSSHQDLSDSGEDCYRNYQPLGDCDDSDH